MLTRDTNNGMIGGVCAGLATHFNVDVSIMRLLFVALALMGGPGIILYVILWLILPDN